MKTWILKNDLSRSPQAAFRMYVCSNKKPRYETQRDFAVRPKHYFLARKLKSQLKSLTKALTLDAIDDISDAEVC